MNQEEELKEKFGKWYGRFKPFIYSKDFENIFSRLKDRKSLGNRIFPMSADTFRAFEWTDPANINCIIIGQSPYHTIDNRKIPYSDGLAFSCRYTRKCAPSLEEFYNGVDKDYNIKCYREPNLKYLASQGVLLLNSSLTTEEGKPSIHEDLGIWDKFNDYLYKEVLAGFCGIPVICMGASAKLIGKKLFPMCHVIKYIEHPARALREKRDWENDNCFKWANDVLLQNNSTITTIEWDYMGYDDLPW